MKKIISIALLLISFCSYSQRCRIKYIENDEFTKTTNIVMRREAISIKYEMLRSRMIKSDSLYVLMLNYSRDIGCASSESYIILKLENGELLEFKHMSSVDCSESATFTTALNEHIDLLRKHDVIKIRYCLSNKYVDIPLTKDNYFIHQIKCLDNASN